MRERWLAVRVCLWLCALPVRLRLHPLPTLLQHLAPRPGRQQEPISLDMERVVRLVVRVCQARLFCGRMFPRTCLRQTLALYYALTRLGYPAALHVGVRKQGGHLQAHSWVTVDGKPVAERTPTVVFKTIYSFGSTVACSALDRSAQR